MGGEPSDTRFHQNRSDRTRAAAVAGLFYPDEPDQLQHQLLGFLRQNPVPDDIPARSGGELKALIVPHAGFVYSGPVAATAYNLLAPLADNIQRIVLLGPAHRVPLQGVALSGADHFETPLGKVEVDGEVVAQLARVPGVSVNDEAHRLEHCLEVQLPFLQQLLAQFRIVPLVVGRTPASLVADLLEQLWDLPNTLVLFSSDLSHYLDYPEAQRRDHATSNQICQLEGELSGEQACGCHGLNGLLQLGRRRHLQIDLLDLRNSGDTAGDRQRVVGYGAFAVH
ncbi:AmmeMemoRadiSam system protein B [Motiliproteus coralliicola]|uniref:MEMO1 family protein DV711_00610 n=1 Tax=Motiliproteus coralliicola TaxID=2283196 RepID=A0A369WPY7_9GAMM|nr:AmmeMemoRadiSam system protein B [Motiliproteus coralliicola]RDE24140.1 AmmeMemoRadiSam system protein B [Motiliproteus coralliicola]